MHELPYRPDRLLGAVILTVVVAAVGLLIAGYGVPVGFGTLVGLILGFLAGTIGSLWLARGAGRSVSFGGREWSSDWTNPGPDQIAEMQDLAAVSGVSLGTVGSVTPVLATAEAAGLIVQLVTIEHHEGGLAMTIDVRSRPGVLPPGSMARVAISDDVGTQYRASAMAHGGSPTEIRYVLTAIPALPDAATRLDMVIERFVDLMPGAPRDATLGPWSFSVSLNRQ
jgi:hypothetical protein